MTGSSIARSPRPSCAISGDATASSRALAKAILWGQRRTLVVGLVLLGIDRAAGFVLPLAPKVLLDEVVARHRTGLLVPIAAAVVGAAVVQAATAYAIQRVLGLSAERLVVGWRRRLMAHIVRLPAEALDRMQTGVLVSRVMDDAMTMQNLVGVQLARWVSNLATAIVALFALLWIDWRMTLVALGFVAVPGLALDVVHRKLRPFFRLRAEIRSEIAGRLNQTLAGWRVVKAYGAERREGLAFTRGLHRHFRVMAQTVDRRGVLNGVALLVTAGVVAVVVVMGGHAILDGRLSLGDFGSYVAFALLFATPLSDLPEIATRAAETLADLDRIAAIEAISAEDEGDRAKAPLSRVDGEVAFDHVAFAYREGTNVLEDVSFVAPRGSTTAIVGASGAGKSTLFALLLGFRRPTAGRILVDGRDLASVRLRDWRRSLAVVLQDDFLFDGTLAENIALARPEASREDIAAASRAAHCDELVASLPDGLDTTIGERGLRLSGGQRQRVSLARAFLADAPILLLDEATSSLDSESEVAIRDAIEKLAANRTVFVIAHRLSTVRAADQILVLDRGRVVERGTHGELLARAGRYRALHDAQDLGGKIG